MLLPVLSVLEGEVCTRGPHTMTCYWRNPTATQQARLLLSLQPQSVCMLQQHSCPVPRLLQALTAEGWLRTGDMGMMDARGALWLRGRAKDMIKSGGECVYASEVGA